MDLGLGVLDIVDVSDAVGVPELVVVGESRERSTYLNKLLEESVCAKIVTHRGIVPHIDTYANINAALQQDTYNERERGTTSY